jgi:hypothetical protein
MDDQKPKAPGLYAGFILAVLVLSCIFTWLRFRFSTEYEHASLAKLLAGKADLPFQYRVLAPWIAELIYQAVKPLGWVKDPAQLFKATEFMSSFFLLVAYRRFLSLFFPEPRTNMLLALTLYLVMPFNLMNIVEGTYYYPSDMPSLLFFTLGLTLLCRKDWKFFYPLFVIATFNRETSCFLSLVFLFTAAGKEPLTRIGFHLGLQSAIWVAIKMLLWRIYQDNPGAGIFENHFRENLSLFRDYYVYLVLACSMGSAYLPALMGYRKIQNDFLRRSVLVMAPFGLGMMVVSKITELRVWAELIPILLTASLIVTSNWVREDKARRMTHKGLTA